MARNRSAARMDTRPGLYFCVVPHRLVNDAAASRRICRGLGEVVRGEASEVVLQSMGQSRYIQAVLQRE